MESKAVLCQKKNKVREVKEGRDPLTLPTVLAMVIFPSLREGKSFSVEEEKLSKVYQSGMRIDRAFVEECKGKEG